MEDSQNLRWRNKWSISYCAACSSALREQLSSSNRCAMLIGKCDNWSDKHPIYYLSSSLTVAGKSHVTGNSTYGWKLSNASRRKLLEKLDEEFSVKQ